MTGVRNAFVWATGGRYFVMAINLVATLVIARLLAPAEYGVSVLGAAIFGIAEAVRALSGGAYLIQQKDLTQDNIRTSFTINLIVTGLVIAALFLLAGPLTRAFDTPDVARYLQVSMFGYLAGPFVYPMSALMSRRMAFRQIAIVTVATAAVNAACGVGLGLAGFGYMSLAWASAISGVFGMILYLGIWRDWSIFRPLLREWRSVIAFGAYDGATAVLSQLGESLPFLIFGRLLNAEAVGLVQRTMVLCLFPERVILAGVGAVALPAFSRQMRDGGSLKHDYLRAIELITAAQWPALLLLIALAHPIVATVLGHRWMEVAPLVEILAAALLFSFPVTLTYPVLVAVGAIRLMPPVVVAQVAVSFAFLALAARGGLHAAALSALVIVPLNGLLSLLLVQHFVGFGWTAFAAALWRSTLAAALSAAGPGFVALAAGGPADISLAGAVVAGVLAGVGWIAGLWVTRHPLLHEMLRALAAVRRSRTAARLRRQFGR
jgi:O-antigen/teichoic acid export membrane protein